MLAIIIKGCIKLQNCREFDFPVYKVRNECASKSPKTIFYETKMSQKSKHMKLTCKSEEKSRWNYSMEMEQKQPLKSYLKRLSLYFNEESLIFNAKVYIS